MKIILWAEIMANGFYPHASSESRGFQTAAEVWADFYQHIAQAGNVIFGRKTMEEVLAAGGDPHYAKADVVAISRRVSELPGMHCAPSPQQAIAFLEAKGHTVAFVGGGETVLNAFLAEGLADELIFLIPPAIGGREFSVALPEGQHKDLRLQSVRELGSGCVKLHYLLERG
ncbi:MAG: dihydrofolate reductase family protein [Thermaceae bacterium]|nr:dihydrofolate reductase family protein [Thermaceae bacterium]